MWQTVGIIASLAMPLWNIPMILRIEQCKSSKDISLAWALGIFACLILMLPAALVSADPVFKVFALANVASFSLVVVQVIRYR